MTEYKVGDKVCALVSGGGYAEYCNAPVPQVLPIPEGALSMIEGAGVPEIILQFGQMFFRKVVFRKEKPSSFMEDLVELGQRQFSWLISMELKLSPLQVVKKNAQSLLRIGCWPCHQLSRSRFCESGPEITSGKGVELILDMVGGDYIQKNISC